MQIGVLGLRLPREKPATIRVPSQLLKKVKSKDKDKGKKVNEEEKGGLLSVLGRDNGSGR